MFAVGTSSVRTLETVSDENGFIKSGSGYSELFMYPGYTFKCVDAMITNFHLPDAGPIFLTAAFLHNRKNTIDEAAKIIKNLYTHAVEKKYRFYSYGDAMLII